MLPKHRFIFPLNTTLLTGFAIVTLAMAISGTLMIGSQKRAISRKWHRVLQEHLTKYPAMQLEDVYKLIFQATCGPAHLDRDCIRIGQALKNESATLTPAAEPLIELISPERRFVRLNLKSYIYHHGNLDSLAAIVYQSAQLQSYPKTELAKRWQLVGELIEQGKLPFERSKYDSLSQILIERGYPSIHHSPLYRLNYQPAYRVIAWEVWQRSSITSKLK